MFTAIVSFNTIAADFLTPEKLYQIARIILILVIGIPLLKIATRVTGRVIQNKFSHQSEILIKRFVYYLGVLIILITVMNECGFKLSALLGAAGILGIAIGFASQTSISNIISGIFLISEKPFIIGDLIQVGSTIGNVMSIDLLSIKVRTPDNRFVRIPNENMIKNEIINITRFPTRRLNLNLSVSYKDDLVRVMALLREIALKEPLALKDPEPFIQIEQYAVTGVNILYGVWSKQEAIIELKNAIMLSIKSEFHRKGIGIPFTYTSVSGHSTEEEPQS
jgi:small-conductance mechanosensitive channel